LEQIANIHAKLAVFQTDAAVRIGVTAEAHSDGWNGGAGLYGTKNASVDLLYTLKKQS
jgi:hypothetical protein